MAIGTLNTCTRCGYSWNQRQEARPSVCPSCTSRLWDVPEPDRPELECAGCGHVWTTRLDERLPEVCPKCGTRNWQREEERV